MSLWAGWGSSVSGSGLGSGLVYLSLILTFMQLPESCFIHNKSQASERSSQTAKAHSVSAHVTCTNIALAKASQQQCSGSCSPSLKGKVWKERRRKEEKACGKQPHLFLLNYRLNYSISRWSSVGLQNAGFVALKLPSCVNLGTLLTSLYGSLLICAKKITTVPTYIRRINSVKHLEKYPNRTSA